MAKCILVVDDEPVISTLAKRKLQDNGYEVMTAKDGLEALEMLKKRIPDLILLDVEMPRMDGYTFIMQRSKIPEFVKIPFIVLTSHAEIEPMFKRHGVKAYLIKPLEIDALLEKVRAFAGG